MTLESMYLQDNQEGFDAALGDTINYNKSILQRSDLHDEITNHSTVAFKQKLQEFKKSDEPITEPGSEYSSEVEAKPR